MSNANGKQFLGKSKPANESLVVGKQEVASTIEAETLPLANVSSDKQVSVTPTEVASEAAPQVAQHKTATPGAAPAKTLSIRFNAAFMVVTNVRDARAFKITISDYLLELGMDVDERLIPLLNGPNQGQPMELSKLMVQLPNLERCTKYYEHIRTAFHCSQAEPETNDLFAYAQTTEAEAVKGYFQSFEGSFDDGFYLPAEQLVVEPKQATRYADVAQTTELALSAANSRMEQRQLKSAQA